MKKNFTIFLALLPLLLLTGCLQEPPAAKAPTKLINVTAILEEQIEYYLQNPPQHIEKRMVLNGREETATADTTSLAQIREMMQGYDVTGASFVNSFNEEVQELKPGIFKKTLQAKPDANIAIRSVELIYTEKDTVQEPIFLLVHKQDENLLYQTRQVMALYFNDSRLTRIYASKNQHIILLTPTYLQLEYIFEE